MTKTHDAQAPSPDEAAATSESAAESSTANGVADSAAHTAGDAATSPDKSDAAHRRAVTAGTAPAMTATVAACRAGPTPRRGPARRHLLRQRRRAA